MSNFIDKCITGEALLEDIDEYVEAWHVSEDDSFIHDFLGMKEAEYAMWIKFPDVLPFIVNAHKNNNSIEVELNTLNTLPMAARSNHNIEKLIQWLKKENIID